jgi:hypothetical protein
MQEKTREEGKRPSIKKDELTSICMCCKTHLSGPVVPIHPISHGLCESCLEKHYPEVKGS